MYAVNFFVVLCSFFVSFFLYFVSYSSSSVFFFLSFRSFLSYMHCFPFSFSPYLLILSYRSELRVSSNFFIISPTDRSSRSAILVCFCCDSPPLMNESHKSPSMTCITGE